MNPAGEKVIRVAIFGASSGIGSAVARRFTESGARIVLVGRDREKVERVAADLGVRGAADVVVQIADLGDPEAMPKIVEAAWAAFDGLDVGLITYGTLTDQARAQRDQGTALDAIVINFTSPVMLCEQLAVRFEAQRSGTLAVVTSVAGDRGRQSNYLYGAAKGGLQRYLEGLRHRVAAAGVRVVDVRPGFVSTPMTAHLPQGGPLWVKPDIVAGDIIRAIARGSAVQYTPWFWRPIMLLVRNIPRALFHRSRL